MPSPAELKTVGDDSCSTLEEEEEEDAMRRPIRKFHKYLKSYGSADTLNHALKYSVGWTG
jgi:hypothetical protein